MKISKKYKTLIFDMDGTLSVSKSPLSSHMAELFSQTSNEINMVIITGGLFKQIKSQCIDLFTKEVNLSKIYILPTSGSKMKYYNTKTNSWDLVYNNKLSLLR